MVEYAPLIRCKYFRWSGRICCNNFILQITTKMRAPITFTGGRIYKIIWFDQLCYFDRSHWLLKPLSRLLSSLQCLLLFKMWLHLTRIDCCLASKGMVFWIKEVGVIIFMCCIAIYTGNIMIIQLGISNPLKEILVNE